MPSKSSRPPPRTKFVLLGVIAGLTIGLLLPSPTWAAYGLTVKPDSGRPGDSITATATGFPPGTVSFRWDMTVVVGEGTSNGIDAVKVKFAIPSNAAVGPHPVWACEGSTAVCQPALYAEAIVTVIAPTPKPTPRATPRATPKATPTPEPTPTPLPTRPPIPIPSFPIAAATPAPTPLPFVAITPAPKPPGDYTGAETEFPNLRVRAIEVTQGIQNLANDMPLVSHRRTYARVYVDVTGNDSWPNTWGAIEARRGGQQIGWTWPDNGPIVARAGTGDRTSLDDSLLFRLPSSWTSGVVTLTAFVFSYTVATPFTREPSSDDNFRSETVVFQDGEPLTLHLAPLHIHRSYHASDVERIYSTDIGGDIALPGSNLGTTERIVSGAYRFLPIASLNVDTLTAPVTPIGHANGHEFQLGAVCNSPILSWASNHIEIADWTILVEEPEDVTIDAYTVPDRPTLQVMDRIFTADYFYPRDDGTGDLWGSSSGLGPNPIPGAPAYAYPCLIITGAHGEPNNTLALYRVFYDWSDEREEFVGMVHPSMLVAFGGGLSTENADAVTIRMTDSFGTSFPWDHSGAGTLAHESAHQTGLGHVPCKNTDGDKLPDELEGGPLDLTHPMTLTFPDCWLSEVDDEGYYGFDVYWDRFGLPEPTVLSNDPAAPAPNRAFPLLSYQGPAWVDPYHYCRMLRYFGVPCSASELGLPWNPPNPKPDGSDPFAASTPPPAPIEKEMDATFVVLTQAALDEWTIDLVARNSNPTLDLLERIANELALEPDENRPWLVVLGPDGSPMWQATIPQPELPHGATGSAPIAMVVPLPPDASAVEVRGWDAATKGRLEGSAAGPTISRLATDVEPGANVEPGDEIVVSFEARDPDGDGIRGTVLYSPDGEHWQVVGVEVDRGRAVVPVDDLPSGPEPAFKVVVDDGWSDAEATIGVPELAAPRNPPSVMILASGPARYPLHANVRLEAAAFDLEDRSLPGNAISWASSIDGALGSGSELATRALSPGRHEITATATDSDGLTGHASYVLEIDPSIEEALPGADLEAAVGGVFERLAAGLDPAPPQEFPWLPIGIGLIVLAAVGGGLVLRWRVVRATAPTGTPGTPHEAAHVVQQGGERPRADREP